MVKKLFFILILAQGFASLSKAKTWVVPAGSCQNSITVETEYPATAKSISCEIEEVPVWVSRIAFVNNNVKLDEGYKNLFIVDPSKTGVKKLVQPKTKIPSFNRAEKQQQKQDKAIAKKFEITFDVDENITDGSVGFIKLKFGDSFGRVWHKSIEIKTTAPTIQNQLVGKVTTPTNDLKEAIVSTPNPFSATAEIKFTLLKQELVELNIYDIQGRLVKTVINEQVAPGVHSFKWDGKNNKGVYSPNGVYFVKLKAGSNNAVKKLVYVK
ncbi:MAG: FlgD immunoglobulin-like domain containing protein [Desulfocucumaceae bacterium]